MWYTQAESVLRRMKGAHHMNNTFFASVSRMKYINRWALMRNTREENLSEHSLETAVIAHALCVIGNRRFGRQIGRAHV